MRPNTEMSSSHGGFDLKAAREICEELLHPGKECGASCQFCDEAKTMLPAALDEIEWLIQLVDETATQLSACRSVAKMIRSEQAKRIAGLEAALHVEKSAHEETKYADSEAANQAFSRIVKQRAALKKLGAKVRALKKEETELVDEFENRSPGRYRYLESKIRLLEPIHNADCAELLRMHETIRKLGKKVRARGKALVEERAKRLVADRGDCPYRSPIKNQLISRCDKGIICDWCQCPIKDEWQDEAREQLRREGKL